jgi:site-specific DNA recombinase
VSALIYLRVSTDEQAEEGYSLQAQERACRLFCELQGHQVAGVWSDEGYSGARADRPALQALLANIQRGDIVLVHKLDRFSRSTRLLLECCERLEQAGAHLVSVSELIDFASPIGKVMLSLLGAFAQYYLDNLRAETAKGHREKAQRGLWVGPAPFGYAKLDKGHLVPNENAQTVREIYRLYVEQGLSYGDIAAELRRRGLASPRSAWGRENVRVILRSRAYLGYVSAGGVEHAGVHEPLVSHEVWAQVAGQRAQRTPQLADGPQPASWAGLLHCARCGKRLWFHQGGRGDDPRSYYCPNSRRGSCSATQFRAERIEAQIDDLVELLSVEDIHQIVMGVYVEEGEIISLLHTHPYEKLLRRLGYTLGVPDGDSGTQP